MTLLTVVNEVCATVGVHATTTVFGGINANRTMLEMVETANEMAAQIATDLRDWTKLRKTVGPTTVPSPFLGDGVQEAFPLPADYRRMLATSEVWLSNNTLQPALFIPDTDEWLQRRVADAASGAIAWMNATSYVVNQITRDSAAGNSYWKCRVSHVSAPTGTFADDRAGAANGMWQAASAPARSSGEWTIYGGEMHIQPVMGIGTSARFTYLDKNHIELRNTNGALLGLGEKFTSDNDTFRLDERLLKLGMIWRWKQLKGSPYAEDLGSWSNSMATAMGSDSPAPILIGRTPISANTRYAYPWNAPT
jgi:alkylhydroperoxidase family enzyme